jgi:hypothetical protein
MVAGLDSESPEFGGEGRIRTCDPFG